MYSNLKDLFKGICDSIRQVEGSHKNIPHQDIPQRILDLSGGGSSNVFRSSCTRSSIRIYNVKSRNNMNGTFSSSAKGNTTI